MSRSHTGTPSQAERDAPGVARLLQVRSDWTRGQLAAAAGISYARVQAAISALRRQGICGFRSLALRADWTPAGLVPGAAAEGGAIAADWMPELAELHALSRRQALTNEESERMGMLLLIEQRETHLRPGRLSMLRAITALFEDLELAERGTRPAAVAALVAA